MDHYVIPMILVPPLFLGVCLQQLDTAVQVILSGLRMLSDSGRMGLGSRCPFPNIQMLRSWGISVQNISMVCQLALPDTSEQAGVSSDLMFGHVGL